MTWGSQSEQLRPAGRALGDTMDCKEFNSLIQDFLNDRLSEMKLSEFLGHIESCEDCRDELRIQYLIYENELYVIEVNPGPPGRCLISPK